MMKKLVISIQKLAQSNLKTGFTKNAEELGGGGWQNQLSSVAHKRGKHGKGSNREKEKRKNEHN